jgi:hypothetical protein
MSEWIQMEMFSDPVADEVKRRCEAIAKREDWREYIEREFNGISGGMVDGFCWEFSSGRLFCSDQVFNSRLPGPEVRIYTKQQIISLVEERL